MRKSLLLSLKKWKEVGALAFSGAVFLSFTETVISDGLDATAWQSLLIFQGVILLAYFIAWFFTRPYRVTLRVSQQENDIPCCPVVVTPLSPFNPKVDNLEVIRNLVQHHAPTLQTLCLVCTPAKQGVQDALTLLDDWLTREFPGEPRLHPDKLLLLVPVKDIDNIAEIHADVLHFTGRLKVKGERINFDVTAGFKPLSIALTLVAQELNALLTYQVSDRDNNGNAIPGTARMTRLKLEEDLAGD